MEHQLENHMRLPPPVTNGNFNASTGPEPTLPHQPSHQHQQQHMSAAQQSHSHSIVSPSFAATHAAVFYGASSPPLTSPANLGRSSATSDTTYSPPSRPRGWPSGNPYSVYYTPGYGQSADSPAKMDIDSSSSGTRGPLSPDTLGGRASSVSLDDPDVKMAAEALGDLKANFISSPRNRTSPLPNSPSNQFGTPGPPEAEPLLSLVMTSGSLLAKPIEGTVSAYNTTKNRTPGFIKAPVEYVEGVVGSGLHLSGIEGGVRWFFRGKGRQHSSSDLETGENSHKRRRVNGNGRASAPSRRPDVSPLTGTNGAEVDPYCLTDNERRMSINTVDTLPAYDDARSPAYTEYAMASPNEKADGQVTPTTSRPSSTPPSAWQSRLMLSTSGLSIAMSEESLRSLKYCLSWLRWANEHIGRVIDALKENLEQYEKHGHIRLADDHAMGHDPAQARRELGARISALRCDVLKTLQGVIETVSKYAGGALPDNARALVRRHLTSLPQRFRLAAQMESSSSSNGAAAAGSPSSGQQQADVSTEEGQEKEVREGAQRVLVLAKEGLDMMAQVSGVLDGTIVSAEEWCERLGKKRRTEQTETTEAHQQQQKQQPQHEQQQDQTVPFMGVVADTDFKMG
ncbi:transcriptional regulator opi1 [Gnomoniopsis sp. IMI 355080]|nr:transcriptional regulator opi1 [Gnomoniopsis sp. IMI 355080]